MRRIFCPVTLVLTAVLWLFTMTGGSDIFVKEVLGGAYDSQAEHSLRGDVGVDSNAIAHETMIVNGKVRMYLGRSPRCSNSAELRLSTRAQ